MNDSDKILQIYNVLQGQASLTPSPEVDAAFSQLVNIALQNHGEKFSQEVELIIPKLHVLSAEGEYELEQFWANRIIKDPFPMIRLEEYPYYHNYELLTQLEYQSLRVLGERSITKVLFVGSGPLPLAAIILAKRYGIAVVCVDKDAEATALSAKLVKVLGLENLITIIWGDAHTNLQAGDFDVVIMAALVGMTQEEKLAVLEELHTSLRPGTLMVIRTAHGGRRLLYPYINERSISNFNVHAVILPQNEVVNSVIIAEKPISESTDIVIKDKANLQIFTEFRSFAFKCISEQYNFRYNPLWHRDIDIAEQIYSLEKANLFAAYINGIMVGAVAVRPLEYKYDWQRERYIADQVGAVWRYFIDPQYAHTSVARQLHEELERFARKQGYTKLCAHEQGFVSGALGKYIGNGYVPIHEDHDQLETIHIEKQL